MSNRLVAEFREHAQHLLSDFTGREWLVAHVRAWREDPHAKPYLLILGEAGIGKSAFAAYLWLQQKMVTAAHFCIAGRGGTTEPRTFVEALSDQLAEAVEGFRAARQEVLDAYRQQPVTVNIYSQVETGDVYPGAEVLGAKVSLNISILEPEQAFDLYLRRPLQALAGQGRLPRITLLVDALDEAAAQKSAILNLIQQSRDLPPQVRWVLTSRREPHVTATLADLPTHTIEAESPENQADIRRYLDEHWIALSPVAQRWGGPREAFLERLAERSEWNFLYLTLVVPDLAQGKIASLDDLPKGLDGYYRYLLDTRVGLEAWREWGAALMETVLALQEPGDLDLLAGVLGWERRPTRQRLEQVAQLLDPALWEKGRYYRHHWSVAEFLDKEERAQEYWCDVRAGHRRIAEHFLLRWGGLEAGLPAPRERETPGYGTRHVVSHLLAGGQWARAHRLLTLEWQEDGRGVNAWLTVQDRLGEPEVFLRDLRAAWETVAQGNAAAAEKERPIPHLGVEIRYALMQASVNSLAGNIPPELMAALLEHGIWRPAQALAYARRVPGPSQRAEALGALAARLPEGEREAVLAEALAAAREIGDERRRAAALGALAARLAASPRAQLYPLWRETLPALARRTRRDLLRDLRALLPVIVRLGGAQAAAETARAIQEVARWWP